MEANTPDVGRNDETPKVGRMKLKPMIPGEYRYAVAIRDDSGLSLTLWVKRSPKGEFFVMAPRAEPGWDPHVSYHEDGTFHSKSFDGSREQNTSGHTPDTVQASGRYAIQPTSPRLSKSLWGC
jgi:hypothetical protein